MGVGSLRRCSRLLGRSRLAALVCLLAVLACEDTTLSDVSIPRVPPLEPARVCGECEPWETCAEGSCECTPVCSEESACLDDSCGGRCECPPGYQQNGAGRYVPEEECHDTCEVAGWACGNVCGNDCGSCGEGLACEFGECVCEPRCDGVRCDDGCGGICPCAEGLACDASGACVDQADCHDSCGGDACGVVCGTSCGGCDDGESCSAGACVEAASCGDCPVVLRLVDQRVVDGGRVREVRLALESVPKFGSAPARLVDVTINATTDVWLSEVEEGSALTESGRALYRFARSEKKWMRQPDGSHRVGVLSGSGALSEGRIATLVFRLDSPGPVEFSLVRSAQVFAPPAADAALQSTAYDGAVIVTR